MNSKTRVVYKGPIAGISFNHYRFRPDRLKNRDLVLVQEPENPYDPAAIRVDVINGTLAHKVGYIPRVQTWKLHRVYKAGGKLRARCHEVQRDVSPSEQAQILVEEILSAAVVAIRRKAKLGLNPAGTRRLLL